MENRQSVLALGLVLALAASGENAGAGGFQCGDALIGPNEQCDDGNAESGDGCSEFCLIEDNYSCTGPFIPTGNNVVVNPGFESFSDNWNGFSNAGNEIFCSFKGCPDGFVGRDGIGFAQFGNLSAPDQAEISQDVDIPSSHRYLEFDLWMPACDIFTDELVVQIDEQTIFSITADDPLCNVAGYQKQRIDLETAPGGPFNDDSTHQLRIAGTSFFQNDAPTVFVIDNVRIVEQTGNPVPGFCELDDLILDYVDFDPGVAGNLGDLGLITFELGDPVPWGTTDDGICGTGQLPIGNVTGGGGEAACLDATATGGGNIQSLFCTGPIDFQNFTNAELTFLLNVQLGQKTPDDFFTVLVGNELPDPGTINNFEPVFQTFNSLGEFGAPPGIEINLNIGSLDGQPEGFVCFLLSSTTAFYAQVDNVQTAAGDCTDDLDEDKLLGCFDNCTDQFNPSQFDSDGDGYGNACDADINRELVEARVPSGNGNDCIVNVADLGVLRLAFLSTPSDENWNPDADLNADGIVNVQDLGIMRSLFFAPPGPSSATARCTSP